VTSFGATSSQTTASMKLVENPAVSSPVAELAPAAAADPDVQPASGQTPVSAAVPGGVTDAGVLAAETPEIAAGGAPVISANAAVTATSSLPAEISQAVVGSVQGETVPVQETQAAVSPLLGNLAASAASPAKSTVDSVVTGKLSTPATVSVQSSDVVQQVLRQMSATLQSGPASMHLQLHPRELGAIDVQMVKSAQGISVTFFAEQASTGRLLEAQMDQLRQALTDSGIQLSNLNIGQHGQPGQQGGSFKQASQFSQYANANRGADQNETEMEDKNKLQTERIGGQLQGVDYRI